MRKLLKIFFLILWAACLVMSPADVTHANALDDIQWQKLETRYSVILYQSLEDLKQFNRKIDYSPQNSIFGHPLLSSGSDNWTENLINKVDALFKRVQDILEMRKQTQKVFINIYPNKNQLNTAYRKIVNSTYETFPRLRAWYIYENNTIYININDLHTNMLAHEMAHSIIDHYLSVRPPRAAAEILARYVGSHL